MPTRGPLAHLRKPRCRILNVPRSILQEVLRNPPLYPRHGSTLDGMLLGPLLHDPTRLRALAHAEELVPRPSSLQLGDGKVRDGEEVQEDEEGTEGA